MKIHVINDRRAELATALRQEQEANAELRRALGFLVEQMKAPGVQGHTVGSYRLGLGFAKAELALVRTAGVQHERAPLAGHLSLPVVPAHLHHGGRGLVAHARRAPPQLRPEQCG